MQLVKPQEHHNTFNLHLDNLTKISWEDFYPGDIVWFDGKPKWRKKSDDTWEDLQTN